MTFESVFKMFLINFIINAVTFYLYTLFNISNNVYK